MTRATIKNQATKNLLRDLNWSLLNNNNLRQSQMVEVFDYILSKVLNHHAPLKKCFIRNNKNSFQLADKWLTSKFPETNF